MITTLLPHLLLTALLTPGLSFAETRWNSEALGLECTFPLYWELEALPLQTDLAKGGTLVRAERTPGLPAGVRFELQLEPLTIKRSSQQKASDELLSSLRQTPQLQILKSNKTTVSENVIEIQVTWKIAQSRNTLESVYRILDFNDRRLVASVSGRVELVKGLTEELNQIWDSIRAD